MRADVALHAAQVAGLAQSAHRIDHRIQKAEKQQTQIIALAKTPSRIGKGAVRLTTGSLDPLLKFLDELPAAEIALTQRRLLGGFGGHAAMKQVRAKSYK